MATTQEDSRANGQARDIELAAYEVRDAIRPFKYRQLLCHIHQGGRPVDDYTEEFYQLISMNELM